MLTLSIARSISGCCKCASRSVTATHAAAATHAIRAPFYSSPFRAKHITHKTVFNRVSHLRSVTSQFSVVARKKQDSKPPNNVEEQPSPTLDKQVRDLSKDIKGRLQAARVHENIYTLPNILTFSRLIAAPVIGYLVLKEQHAWAVGLFAYAGITDLVDGWIARRWNLQTVVGTVIDPLADKLLMTILTICLAVQGALPVWLATIILGRDVSLAISAIYYRFASLPPPKTLARYWDFSLPSAEVHPTGISKANTLLQLLLIGAATAMPIAAPAVEATLQTAGLVDAVGGVHGLMTGAQYLVAATTIWSGASYLYTRNAVTILNGDPDVRRRILTRGRTILGASFASCLALALALEY